MPHFYEDERLAMLRRSLSTGTAQEISTALEAIKVPIDSSVLSRLFANDPLLLASFCNRLAKAETWAEFDDVYGLVAPQIKDLLCSRDSEFASLFVTFAYENNMDPNRFQSALKRFKNEGINISSAEDVRPDTHIGRVLTQRLRAEQQQTAHVPLH